MHLRMRSAISAQHLEIVIGSVAAAWCQGQHLQLHDTQEPAAADAKLFSLFFIPALLSSEMACAILLAQC